MKKYIVIKSYNDKHTGETHLEGTQVELTDARAKELRSGKYIKEASKTTKEK